MEFKLELRKKILRNVSYGCAQRMAQLKNNISLNMMSLKIVGKMELVCFYSALVKHGTPV